HLILLSLCLSLISCLFSSIAPRPTVPSTLSLHDALPISMASRCAVVMRGGKMPCVVDSHWRIAAAFASPLPMLIPTRPSVIDMGDRKSTRLNSSHGSISYAVFCLKKKNQLLLAQRQIHVC